MNTINPAKREGDPEIAVTVIVPTLNERAHIKACLDSIVVACEGFSAEILVLDGMSTDGTREIVSAYQNIALVRLVDNPDVHQVHALNAGILASRGQYIIRCDAHSIYPPTYIKNILFFYEKDQEKKYGNVGTTFVTKTAAASALKSGISLAMSSRLGVGTSHRHYADIEAPREVDTLLFGAWRREVFNQVGVFDKSFIRGQDFEHNLRIRRAGLRVALVPGDPFVYYTRPTFRKMRKMVFQYAYVKGQLARKFGRLPNLRSMAPAVFMASSILSVVALGVPGLIPVAAYLLIIAAHALKRSSVEGLLPATGMLLAIPQMHAWHAMGFLRGLLSDPSHQAFIKKVGHTR